MAFAAFSSPTFTISAFRSDCLLSSRIKFGTRLRLQLLGASHVAQSLVFKDKAVQFLLIVMEVLG